MRLTYNAQKFMAAIAAIAMFCFGPAMAAGTGLEKVYQACPGNKFAGDEIGKDKSKCYEKVTIYDVRVACLTLKKAGDGVSPVYKNALLTSKYNDVTASKDRCYNVSNGSFYSSSQSGDDPSTSESATCRDDFSKQTSGTFYKSETDSVTAKSDRPYCTNPTSGYFYGNPSDRPYIEYYNGCYAIGSASQLYGFADAVNNMTEGEICGTLVDNIVVNENVLTANGTLNGDGSSFTPWTPIKVMSGEKVTLNGNGKTISGLYFNNERNGYVGLFGEVKGTVSISELGIKDSYIKGFYYVGGLVGYNNVGGTLSVTNSYNAGIVTGKNNVGGLVGGSSATLTITNCYNVGTVSGDYYVGGFVGKNYDATLTITNSFFLGEGNNYGGTGKSADEFANGTVARLLHNYVQTGCKENCIDGTIWGQDVLNGDLLPNFSDKITGTLYDLVLHTFDDDNRSYPTYYLSEKGLELPTDLTRKNYVFLGWSAKETPGSSADIVTSIAKGETGTKMFYAQWMKVNEKGCYEIGTAFELYGFANVVNNATYGSQICGTLAENIVVNENVLKTNGALNGEGSNFTPWTLVNVQSGVQVTLNGNGKTISGLYFNDENRDNVGLFGEVYGTVSISNLGVKDSYFKGRNNVGGLVGCNGEKAKLTIENSYNSGTVSGSGDNVGGLVGYSYNGILTITNSYNAGPVSGSGNNVGGLVGISSGELSITNSYNSGTVSGNGIFVGGLVGDNVGENAKLTITNSFFLETRKSGDDLGGEVKALDDFHNGTVAFLLHNWCEMDGDNCKVGGLDGTVWGQDFTKENSLPDLSGKFVGDTPHTLTLHTFEGDTRKLPIIYLEGSGLKLPTDLTRKNYVFLGWSAKETAESFADIVTSIAKNETGAKEFYAQWKELNADGCFEIASTVELYGFANVVNNATEGEVCGTLVDNIVVNMGVLNGGTLNGDGSGFTPWTPIKVTSGKKVTLNGNGKTISGLYFNDGNQDNVGLFGEVTGALSISNLGVKDSYFKGKSCVGGFVGYNNGKYAKLTITNSYNAGAVTGKGGVGGLVGHNDGTLTITNSYNVGTVSTVSGSDGFVGGLVGYNHNGGGTLTITNSYNVGTVSTVSGSDGFGGGLVGMNNGSATLTITNSFFLGKGDNYGGTGKSAEEFHNGTVALLLRNWCEKDGDNCKVGGLDGSVWGQDVLNGDLLPNFSDKITGTLYDLVLHTFDDDNRSYPTNYLSEKGLKLPTDLTRENYVFLGWSAKETAESFADIVTSIAKNATGAKEFYAQWKELNADGCFEIASTVELYGFANVVNNATEGEVCGTLVDNIVVNMGVLNGGTLNGAGSGFTPWTPIKVTSGKKVTLNGNGKTISGLYFNDENRDNVGLFGEVYGTVSISNLGVKDSYFKGRNNVGGLVGCNGENAKLTIENSYNSGTVSGSGDNVGGLVGYSSGTLDIANSYNEGTVSGRDIFGGLVGYSSGTLDIANSYNAGTVSGRNIFGGLVGYSSGTLDITNSYNAGTVSGTDDYVGGLVGCNGENAKLTIENSYNAGSVSGNLYVSGLVGNNDGGTLTITSSYNAGTVNGSFEVSGLVGHNDGTLTITNSYNAGTVSGSYGYVGGLVGLSYGELTITNSYNVGTVSTVSGNGDYVGGLVGSNGVGMGFVGTLTITNSYNAGTVSGSGDFVGGLVGENSGTLTIAHSFFLAAEGVSGEFGGEVKALEEFHNGTVALLLHDWCEMDGDNCKVGGLDGSIWGQDVLNGDVLPNFSGKINVETYELVLNTFEGDTRKYPTEYLSVTGLELPMALERENHIFLGWSSKEVAESFSDIVTSIAKNETGAKTFYAQWKELNADGCFEISSTFDLYAFANVVNNATNGSQVCGTLVDNIVVNTGVLNTNGALNGDCSNFTPWTLVNVQSGVQVTLNGNGKTISGLYFNDGNTDKVGLFGDVNGALSISDLGVKDSYFEGHDNVGGLVGDNVGSLTITNSYNEGTVSGREKVGGLVGYNNGGTLTITNSYNAGAVTGKGGVGGLVGYNSGKDAKLTITNSYNSGTVSGDCFVGGLVGDNYGGTLTITSSYNAGTVNGNFEVGGLVGENCSILTITNSYNAGTVSGCYGDVGGVVGANYDGTVSNVYNTGSVSGNDVGVGGVVGVNYGTVSNAYNTGSVSGSGDNVGGVVGSNYDGTVSNVYNTGSVSGSGDNVGGVVGNNYDTVSNGFFNTEVTCKNCKVVEGTTGMSSGKFADGTVALLLRNWCEKKDGSETCKVGGKNGSVWGQDLNDANSLPDFSGVIGIKYSLTLYTFESKTLDYPKEYIEQLGLELPTNVTREGYIFLGWSTKEKAASPTDIVTSIAKDATGAKEFYAQWKELNADGCFEIASTVELYGFANVVNNATNGSKVCGKLTKDIVVNENVLTADGALNGVGSSFTPWNPMTVVSGVQVTLNGNGHTISGLYFNDGNKDNVGLFGEVTGALSISDLGVKDSYFKGRYYVGGLVGYNKGGSLSIEHSYNAGAVSGNSYVGGLVGENNGENVRLTITNSYNAGAVTGECDVGGLVGENVGTLTITNSYNAGTVSGSGSSIGIGGLVGENNGENVRLTITNSYNEGTMNGDKLVGGLVGFSSGPLTITNSYNAGTMNGDGDNVGGLVGLNGATLTITNSFFLGEGDNYGGTGKSEEEFHNGTVARNLHDWCEKEDGSETCKVGGKNGSVWGQDLNDANSLPDFSGKIGHKYGSVVFFYGEDDQVDSAHVDATSELAVDFPNDVVVSGPVKFKRTFAGLGYSTIMLPFTPNCTDDDCVEGVKFFEFNSYTDGEAQATEVSPKDLKANTPYLVQVAGASEIVFKNGGTFNTTTGDAYNSETGEYKVALTGDGAGWTIYGTYEYKTWEEGDAGLGRTYGFAANDGVNDPSIVGKFAKIGAGAYIYPMRAYLEYTAPAALARPAANGEVRTLASLPETINVVIVEKGETGTEIAGSDDASVEQTTRVIGTINTRTGEFKFANDRWFDLQGRYLGVKKPTQKGAYYNNGKKVIVK